MKNDVTMNDIAKRLDVSVVTVSKALAGKSGVSDGLRKSIEDTAAELGYNRAEKNKIKKNQISVGVIVAERFLDEKSSFYWRVYQEISIYAGRHQIFSLLEVVTNELEHSLVLPKLMQQDKCEALIVLGAFDNEYLRLIGENSKIPVFSIDSSYERLSGDAVIADNILGGFSMTRHLIEEGHVRIGYVGTLRATPSIDDRYIGYYKALHMSGLKADERWMIADRDEKTGLVNVEGTFVLPDPGHMPTAFFCNSDYSAMILISKLEEAGYNVPADISVVGFDNYLPEPMEGHVITTYDIGVSRFAKETIELIKERLADPSRPSRAVMIRGNIIKGDSDRPIA